MEQNSAIRQVIQVCNKPSADQWSKEGLAQIDDTEMTLADLMSSIQWQDIEIGTQYLKLLAIRHNTGGIILHGSGESYADLPFYVTDDDIQSAKEDADYLIDMAVNMGIRIETKKLCKDNRYRTYKRKPSYGDIVTLPRDWVIDYLGREQEPEYERRDTFNNCLNHKYDDRWWSDAGQESFTTFGKVSVIKKIKVAVGERDPVTLKRQTEEREIVLTLGGTVYDPDPKYAHYTFMDFWDDQAFEIADMVERGRASTKSEAGLKLMSEEGIPYFSEDFKDYVFGNLPYNPPTREDEFEECWASLKGIISSSYNLKSWENEKFQRLYRWAMNQLMVTRKLDRSDTLDPALSIDLPKRQYDKCFIQHDRLPPEPKKPAWAN